MPSNLQIQPRSLSKKKCYLNIFSKYVYLLSTLSLFCFFIQSNQGQKSLAMNWHVLYHPFSIDDMYSIIHFLGDDDEGEEGEEGEGEAEEKMPTCGDYIMHFLTLFWKIVFAVIPPAGEFRHVLYRWRH